MPNYDYDCTACGAEFEILHSIKETKRKCPDCGKLKLQRAWREVAAYHNHFSPKHPRVDRGKGITGKRRKEKKK